MTDVIGVSHTPFLKVGAGGQDIMGLLSGLGHEKIMHHKEVQFPESLCEGVAIGHSHQGVAADYHEGLQLPRNALRHNCDHTEWRFAPPEFEE